MHSEGIKLIKHYESLHDGDLSVVGLQPKACPVGIWTVGYGRAISDPKTGRFLKGKAAKARAYELYPALTEAQAEAMLLEDLARFEAIVATHTKGLNDYEFAACVSLCYNIGAGAFAGSSVVRHLRNNNKVSAADAFLLWNKGNIDADPELEVLPGLVARRKSERELFLTGKFKPYN